MSNGVSSHVIKKLISITSCNKMFSISVTPSKGAHKHSDCKLDSRTIVLMIRTWIRTEMGSSGVTPDPILLRQNLFLMKFELTPLFFLIDPL